MSRIFRLPLWLKLALLTTTCLTVMASALTLLATRDMTRHIAADMRAAQEENLRTAARILERRAAGVDVRYGPDGNVDRLSVAAWPPFATEDDPDHAYIDYVTGMTGQTATIFAWDPDRGDFVRRTTNIVRPDGSRAVGTVLGSESAAFPPMMRGEPYLGTATILGTSYETLYQPIFTSDADVPANVAGVAGILYVGVENAEVVARARDLTAGLWTTGLFLLAIGTAAVAWACHAVLKPLRSAAGQMEALSRGEKVTVEVTRQDEIGAMQSALMRLAEAAEGAFETQQVLEQSSQPILTASAADDMRITFANRAARDTFAALAREEPRLPASLVGTGLSRLDPTGHDLAEAGRTPAQLPHTRTVRVGNEVVLYSLTAITSREGAFRGVALSATSLTHQERTAAQFETDVASLLSNVDEALATLKSSTTALNEAAATGTRDSIEAAELATRTSEAIQTVAAAVEELNGSFAEVAERIATNAAMAREASSATEGASASARALEEAGQRIAEVVNLIADVAGQTNLLALNATIEASRAGEAGRGFAVVANEVKNLAERSATATSEITAEVDRVNSAGLDLLRAVEKVQTAIRSVDEVSTAVSAAVNQQQVTTSEIARTVGGVADSASRVEHLSQNVNASSHRTGEAADGVARLTADLDRTGQELGDRARSFLAFIREAA